MLVQLGTILYFINLVPHPKNLSSVRDHKMLMLYQAMSYDDNGNI